MSFLSTSDESAATRPGLATIEPSAAIDDQEQRPLEARCAEADARIDEQRGEPAEHEQGDEDAVRLELERQLGREASSGGSG